MNSEAVQEIVELVKEGVAGAEERLGTMLPALAGEVQRMGGVILLVGILTLALIPASFWLGRIVQKWGKFEDDAAVPCYVVPTVISVVCFILAAVCIGLCIQPLAAPHLILLKMIM